MDSPKHTLFVVKLAVIAVAVFGFVVLLMRGVETVHDAADRMH